MNVWGHPVVDVPVHASGAPFQCGQVENLGVGGRRQRYGYVRQIVEIVFQSQCHQARRSARTRVSGGKQVQTAVEVGRSRVVDAVTGAHDRLVLAPPGKRPTESNGGGKVVPVVVVDLPVRVRRVLARELDTGQRTVHVSGFPKGIEAGPRNPEQRGLASDRRRHQTPALVRYAIVVVAEAEVEGKIGSDLPIVLEERAPFILMEITPPRNQLERCIRRLAEIEALTDGAHRAGQVEQQVLRRAEIVARQAGYALQPRHAESGRGADVDVRQYEFRVFRAVETVR